STWAKFRLWLQKNDRIFHDLIYSGDCRPPGGSPRTCRRGAIPVQVTVYLLYSGCGDVILTVLF
ncbi:hypothetical protein J6590_103550, partial [Homalodisca vitripennis]